MKNKKEKVVIIGSTGSIGTQAIDVIETVGDKEIIGLACDSNIYKLGKQMVALKPKYVCVYNERKAYEMKELIGTAADLFWIVNHKKAKFNTKIWSGMDGLIKLATLKEADIIIISVVGMIGIRPTIEAIKHKKIICLANKETLVCAGDIIMKLAKKNHVEIRPIDSEHSAIWQCLQGEKKESIKRLLITASGGPFYGKSEADLKNVTVEDALRHPNWSMGKKITIDSSTLVNKGLEVMEAHHLFDVPYDKIDVVVQRESLIHSMVEFVDGAVKAQLGVPSMRVPIEYAIYKENRKNIYEDTIDWTKLKNISIGKPDLKTFKGLALAYKAIELGGLMPAVYNALNEVAVRRFLQNEKVDVENDLDKIINAKGTKDVRKKTKKFGYLDITKFIEKGMDEFLKKGLNKKNYTLKDVEATMLFAEELMKD